MKCVAIGMTPDRDDGLREKSFSALATFPQGLKPAAFFKTLKRVRLCKNKGLNGTAEAMPSYKPSLRVAFSASDKVVP